MNCQQFNSVKLDEVLKFLGHFPSKENDRESWFLNPFAHENDASFKYDFNRNLWYLFSEGIGGNNIDFIRKYFKCSIQEALNWASSQSFSSFHHQTKSTETNYQLNQVLPITNWNLKKYLQSRNLSHKIYQYINEVKFTMNGTKLYAIGFKNRSDGWELRNSFYKGSILKKDISIIKNNSDSIVVFEGFFDALSYIEMQDEIQEDLLILNSLSLVESAKLEITKYSKIKLLLDNDKSGKLVKASLMDEFKNAEDCSLLYRNYKDLNEFLMQE